MLPSYLNFWFYFSAFIEFNKVLNYPFMTFFIFNILIKYIKLHIKAHSLKMDYSLLFEINYMLE